MIIVKLQGGLGNQMFQYATGRSLALKNNTNLYLDLSFISDKTEKENFTFRNYELNKLNIVEKIASEKQLKYFKPTKAILPRIIRKIFKYSYVLENSEIHSLSLLTNSNNLYLDGYWQNSIYFDDIKELLIKELTIKPTSMEVDSKILEKLRLRNSVAIHIRLGDYISNKLINQVHGICSTEYYHEAVSLIEKKIEKPSYFIFSDDLEKISNFHKFNFPYEVITGKNHFEELFYISNCKHNIIANSSFSWWAAWLNQNPNKIVIAPRQWYVNKESNIVPDKWIKI